MKRTFAILTAAVIFMAACNDSKTEETSVVKDTSDTSTMMSTETKPIDAAPMDNMSSNMMKEGMMTMKDGKMMMMDGGKMMPMTKTMTCTDGCKVMMTGEVMMKDGMKMMMTEGMMMDKDGHMMDKDGKMMDSKMMMEKKM
ncbi:MAG: DUF6799 domain-containing protein [Ferruginibacter sp.]